jgi:predicted phage terminase large subunit-like protein
LLDPAISKQTYADFTAIVSLLVDSQNNIYIVDIVRERLDPFETTKALFAQCEKWNPFRIGVESQAYQKSLIYIINDKKHEAGLGNLNIIEIKADKDKVEKIRGIVHRYAMGQVYHRQGLKNTKILETELMRFPKGATDDVIDALAGIEQILAPKRRVNQQYKHYIERTVGHRQVVY